jgi:hypothetical protein
MPLPLPVLDDRTFDQLSAEAEGLIPRNFPAWTDHNRSDPGITLLELFAFLTEAAIYQLDRVPERSLDHFAALVGVKRTPGESTDAMLHRALTLLSFSYRAVTETEFEILAGAGPNDLISIDSNGTLVPDPSIPISSPAVARAKAIIETAAVSPPGGIAIPRVPRIPVFGGGGRPIPVAKRPASVNVFPSDQTIKVVIVPNQPGAPAPEPTDDLRQRVFQFLSHRRLITARVRVVGPEYVPVAIQVTVVRDQATRLSDSTVKSNVAAAITRYLGPLTGGKDGSGWEFGRSIYRSEIDQLVEGIAGVDHVAELLLNGDAATPELSLPSLTSLVQLTGLTVLVRDS